MTKFTFKIEGLDKVNRNGRFYSKNVIDKAFSEDIFKEANSLGFIPVKRGCNDNPEEDQVIGFCNLINSYPEIEGRGFVRIKSKELKKLKPCLQGCGYVDCHGEVTDYEILSLGLYSNSAFETQIETKKT